VLSSSDDVLRALMDEEAARQVLQQVAQPGGGAATGARPDGWLEAVMAEAEQQEVAGRQQQGAQPEASSVQAEAVPTVHEAAQQEGSAAEDLASLLDQARGEVDQLREVAAARRQRAADLDAAVADTRQNLVQLKAEFDLARASDAQEKASLAGDVLKAFSAQVLQQLKPVLKSFEQQQWGTVGAAMAGRQGEGKVHKAYGALLSQMKQIMAKLSG
jgi:hypothetical protein